MADTYLAIMLQSLRKKEKVLDEIIRLNDLQKKELTELLTPVSYYEFISSPFIAMLFVAVKAVAFAS